MVQVTQDLPDPMQSTCAAQACTAPDSSHHIKLTVGRLTAQQAAQEGSIDQGAQDLGRREPAPHRGK